MSRQVNTVLGPIMSNDMGITLPHEHIQYGYPGWQCHTAIYPYDRQAIIDAGVSSLKGLKEKHNLGVFVDATPIDGGRDVSVLRDVSEKSGVNIVCSTGLYYEHEGMPAYWNFHASLGMDAAEAMEEVFMKELTQGIDGTDIKAGAIKVGTSKGAITDFEKNVLTAAARASKATGAPIITHTQEGTCAPEQAEFLIQAGADPKKLQIGHMSDNTDVRYHMAVLKQGVFDSIDRMGLEVLVGCPFDEERYTLMIGLIGAGWADQMLISHDSIGTWLSKPLVLPEEMNQYVANWHPGHLFEDVIPALKKGGATDEQIKKIIIDNPQRLYGGE